MSRKPINGVEGQDDESPRAKAWGRYQAHQEAMDAEDAARAQALRDDEAAALAAQEEARRLRTQAAARPAPEPARGAGGAAGAVAAAAATFGKAMKQALVESPEARRMDLFAAMQAEALARLEIAPQHEAAQAASIEALGGSIASKETDSVISTDRRRAAEARDPDGTARRDDAEALEKRPVKDKVARGAAPAKPRPDTRPRG